LTIGNTIVGSYQPVTVSGGTGNISVAITPALPNSLSYSSSAGNISGTPIELYSNSSFTFTATDNLTSSTSSKNFYLEVLPKLLRATVNNSSYVLPKYTAVKSFAPVVPTVGFEGYGLKSYSISPIISNIGLSFDENSGNISGTPSTTVTDVAQSYTVTITDSTPVTHQTATGTFNLTISDSAVSELKAILNTSVLKLTSGDGVNELPVSGSGGYTATGNYK
jgi:hypothetical protein